MFESRSGILFIGGLGFFITAFLGVTAVGLGVSGGWFTSLGMASRVALVVGGIGLVDNGLVTDAVGAVLLAVVGWHNRRVALSARPA